MALITKKEIGELNAIHGESCISIYIPTHRVGEEVFERKDVLELKNQLKDVKNKLVKEKMAPRNIKALLAPIQELLDNTAFWRHQSDGLAIFRTDEFFKVFTLPVHFEAFNFVGNNFYLKPLMPMFTGDGKFFVLGLEKKYVKLYGMTRHTITDIDIEDLVPSEMKEEVGYDYEPKSLQYKSGADAHGRAFYHGHAEADNDRKSELGQFFRAVDKGIRAVLRGEIAPLLLVTQEVMFPIYKKENTYTYLLDDFIDQTPSERDKFELHEMAWAKMAPMFDQDRKDKISQFKEHQGSGRTASDLDHVLAEAIAGRVEALFLENRADIWGVYNPEKRHVRVDELPLPSSVSLLNMAAMETFLNGGTVYLLEKDEMPDPYSKINALYRY
ncbi:hypothetical protein ACFQZJ_07680 [Maribacter chungangensis]|uniref:Uncharacterized protein n=1 Tax=Maribacter chungangensis TaxID=1069117 RepID=A0ABW3B2P0_9FLAO